MILNVSGRTDIIAFYTPWFMKRYEEGFVDVRNPFYPKLVRRIYVRDVDAILFCTKNPIPILPYLKDIDKPIEFQVTLTPYKKDIEPNVPDKTAVIEAIKKVAAIIGKEHVSVRYDPIFISDTYSLAYHKKAFDRLCLLLNGYVSRIIVSFIDEYKNVRKNQQVLNNKVFTEDDYQAIGLAFSESAKKNGLVVHTCFEDRNLCEYGFVKGECMSVALAYQLTGKTYKKWKARKEKKCDCVEMVDIGAYNSCQHFCKYCYANFDEAKVQSNVLKHNVNSSLLLGQLESDDMIKVRNR